MSQSPAIKTFRIFRVIASVKASGDRRVAVIPEGPYVIPLYVPDPA
jgi:hypothetical protein